MLAVQLVLLSHNQNFTDLTTLATTVLINRHNSSFTFLIELSDFSYYKHMPISCQVVLGIVLRIEEGDPEGKRDECL